jgi:hypothetical protein
MAMGTRKQREKQEDIWIAHTGLPSAPGHPFEAGMAVAELGTVKK